MSLVILGGGFRIFFTEGSNSKKLLHVARNTCTIVKTFQKKANTKCYISLTQGFVSHVPAPSTRCRVSYSGGIGGFTPGMNLTWEGGISPHQLEFFGNFVSGFENVDNFN
jgi:hypothetical protein